MPKGAPPDEARPVGLARAIREAVRAYLDEIVLFLTVNVGWALLVALMVLALVGAPILVALTPLLALPTAALMRLAVAAARDRSPSWAMAVGELGRLAGRKLLLAAVQLLLLGLGVTNVLLASGIGGLPGAISAIVAGYAVIASSVYAVALWPIVCDPERDAPLREQLRLALAVVVLRPLQLAVLALIAALAVAVSAQLIVPVLFLPSVVLIAMAAYVVPLADRVRAA